jgi:NAD(P)-dependent dehydrogenase (short-subunit alcohol dehydrogenase family)
MRLVDKSIVVTGATGIAAAAALRAATEGARIFVTSLEEGDCRDLVAAIREAGGEASHAQADLTDADQARSAFTAACEYLGRLDGLLGLAGGSGRKFGDGPAHEATAVGWEKTLQINTLPMFLASSLAIPPMRERGGSVVIVSSVLAESPSPHLFATHAYAAAKGAANSYVKALASYYAPDGVRVNAIAPGLVRTPMSRRAAADPETVAYAERKQPLAGGFLEPEHIADAAIFLLSEESRQITGQVLAVDGGWSVTEA